MLYNVTHMVRGQKVLRVENLGAEEGAEVTGWRPSFLGIFLSGFLFCCISLWGFKTDGLSTVIS